MTLGRIVYELWVVQWTEYERGWGQRPDGLTLFETKEEADAHISQHWEREKVRNPSGRTPDEYSSPDAPALMEVSESLYRAVIFGGSHHLFDMRTSQLKTATVSHKCVKHRWDTGKPSLTGKCINCGEPSWEHMIVFD